MQTHRIEQPLPGAQPAYLANGLIGLRVPPIPLPHGTVLVNGYVGLSPEKATEEYADAPYPVGADVQIDGVWLSRCPHLATFESQEYDFACGELRSRFQLQVREVTASIEVLTFCSRTQPALTLQEVVVTVDRPCNLVLQANIDPRGLMGHLAYQCRPAKKHDGILRWESPGALSSVGACYCSAFDGADKVKRRRNDYGHEADMQLTEYHVAAKPGQRCRLRQYGALVPSTLHPEPHWQAARLAELAVMNGFDALRAANREAWADLWKARPVITGPAAAVWQPIVDSAFFYLHSTAHATTPCGLAPYGLSMRCNYSGHMFWDTDTFMLPPLMLTAPDATRAIVSYRSRCVPAARTNALLQGWRGLQFPCQSGNTGCELTPFYAGGSGGLIEQHMSLDVAYAQAQYAHICGDVNYIRQEAWPILSGVAEWIESRVVRTTRGFEIRHITGIDETIDNIHNNAETNGLACVVLREASAMGERLGIATPPAWREIADKMFMPIDPAGGHLLKHDAYVYPGGLCIPETMMLYFPFGYSHSPAVDQATFDWYLGVAPTYFGWPMMAGALAVWAARAGDRALSSQSLDAGIAARVWEPYAMFSEFGRKVDAAVWDIVPDALPTIFLTATGELLSAIYYGFTGLQPDAGEPQGWARYPVSLPEGWDAIEVEQLQIRGRSWRLTARQGSQGAQLEALPRQSG